MIFGIIGELQLCNGLAYQHAKFSYCPMPCLDCIVLGPINYHLRLYFEDLADTAHLRAVKAVVVLHAT